MSRGNNIIVSANPRGVQTEGIIAAGQTPKPGTMMQIDGSVAMGDDGRFTWKVYAPGADGDILPLWVLLPDRNRGKLATDAYAAGDRCFLYAPLNGEELNMILLDVSGTGDDHAVGELLLGDTGTGKLVADTGSPETKHFMLLEAVTNPVADTLAHVMVCG